MKKFNSVDILILDFLKESASRKCLGSIRDKFHFNKRVIFYSNGETQDYVWEFYKKGLIDLAIFNSKNEGLGVGTSDLWKVSRSDWIINFQQDQYVQIDVSYPELKHQGFLEKTSVNQEQIDNLITTLNQDGVGCISLAGYPCGQGIYSDRAHIISREMLLSFDSYEGGYPDGGCGPYWGGPESYNENFIQKRFKEKGLISLATNPPAVADNGKISVRENGDGSVFQHTTDEKRLWVVKKPKSKQPWPEGLTDEEWNLILTDQWVDGTIPKKWQKDSFKFWD